MVRSARASTTLRARMLARGVCCALALTLTACGGGADSQADAGTPSGSSSPTESAITPTAPPVPPTATTVTPGRQLPAPVANARRQAADDFGVPVEQVDIVDYRSQDFPTGALGCPTPGKFYAQVITPGFVVHLAVGDQAVEYHTDLHDTVVRCTGA